jgi:hypothetical protein
MPGDVSQKVTKTRWSKATVLAAQLLAEDELTDEEIARRVGVNRRQLARWKKQPGFAARVRENVEALARECRRRAIALRNRRLARLNARWEAGHRVIAERAADPKMAGVPGGTTGLLVHRVKSFAGHKVEVYEVDCRLLRELRAMEMQAARETGAFVERVTQPPADWPAASDEVLAEELASFPGGRPGEAVALPAPYPPTADGRTDPGGVPAAAVTVTPPGKCA